MYRVKNLQHTTYIQMSNKANLTGQ